MLINNQFQSILETPFKRPVSKVLFNKEGDLFFCSTPDGIILMYYLNNFSLYERSNADKNTDKNTHKKSEDNFNKKEQDENINLKENRKIVEDNGRDRIANLVYERKINEDKLSIAEKKNNKILLVDSFGLRMGVKRTIVDFDISSDSKLLAWLEGSYLFIEQILTKDLKETKTFCVKLREGSFSSVNFHPNVTDKYSIVVSCVKQKKIKTHSRIFTIKLDIQDFITKSSTYVRSKEDGATKEKVEPIDKFKEEKEDNKSGIMSRLSKFLINKPESKTTNKEKEETKPAIEKNSQNLKFQSKFPNLTLSEKMRPHQYKQKNNTSDDHSYHCVGGVEKSIESSMDKELEAKGFYSLDSNLQLSINEEIFLEDLKSNGSVTMNYDTLDQDHYINSVVFLKGRMIVASTKDGFLISINRTQNKVMHIKRICHFEIKELKYIEGSSYILVSLLNKKIKLIEVDDEGSFKIEKRFLTNYPMLSSGVAVKESLVFAVGGQLAVDVAKFGNKKTFDILVFDLKTEKEIMKISMDSFSTLNSISVSKINSYCCVDSSRKDNIVLGVGNESGSIMVIEVPNLIIKKKEELDNICEETFKKVYRELSEVK